MPLELMLPLVVLMVGTSFLSGLFGMVGGLILIGVLLALLPLPDAMVLHAVTQLASNGWRALLWRRHVRWDCVGWYMVGGAVALLVWSQWQYVPDKPVALLALGVTPFLVRLVPAGFRPNPESPAQGTGYGLVCMTLLLLTGVAGPLLDSFFLGPGGGSGRLDRREIVATKAVCQVFGHALKLLYFGGLIDQAASLDPLMAALAVLASMLGTSLARKLLEAMSDAQFRRWAQGLITAVASYYLLYGGYLLIL